MRHIDHVAAENEVVRTAREVCRVAKAVDLHNQGAYNMLVSPYDINCLREALVNLEKWELDPERYTFSKEKETK